MKYEIVELEEMLVEGIGVKTTNENGKAMQDIGIKWQELFEKGEYQKIENKVNQKTIGLYTDYEGDFTKPYLFMAGTQVWKESKELQTRITKVIKSGKYAKFVVIGDMQEAVGKAWEEIWNLPLKRKYTTDFEEYQNIGEDMANQQIHIYIAIQ